MNRLLKRIYTRGYYLIASLILRKKRIDTSGQGEGEKTVFIYFDFEGEYSGFNFPVQDKFISRILQILDNYKLRATWFTVGRIFKNDPSVYQRLIAANQEVGSHTFNHLPPLETSKNKLYDDFTSYSRLFPEGIEGFHSPQGRWSLFQVKLMFRFNYRFDLVKSGKNGCQIFLVKGKKGKKIVRLQTSGDDWELYKYKYNGNQALAHFYKLLEGIRPNETGGIGFHPWILSTNGEYLEAFETFIKDLHGNKAITLKSTGEITGGFA